MGTGRVWLIRHGESESNAGLPGAGPALTPLTSRGHRQADLISAAVPEPPALIVTSPFLRAGQTALPTITRLPGAPVERWPVQEFTYLGDPHGALTTDRQRAPYARAFWQRANPYSANDGAESFADLLDRVRDCLRGLDRQPAGPVTVFTHGTFTRALLWSLLAAPRDLTGESMRRFRGFADTFLMPNACIVELRFPGPRVTVGSTAHLRTLPREKSR